MGLGVHYNDGNNFCKVVMLGGGVAGGSDDNGSGKNMWGTCNKV